MRRIHLHLSPISDLLCEAMDKCIHIPMDFRSRTQFRVLQKALQDDASQAAGLVLLLFGEMAYAARQHPVGFIPAAQMNLFLEEISETSNTQHSTSNIEEQNGPASCPLISASCLIGLLTDPANGYLKAVEGGWICAEFSAENRHLSPSHMTLQQKGGNGRAVKYARQHAEKVAQQQSLLVDPELYLKPDGGAMDSEEINRVMTVIKLFDNILKRSPRLTTDYSPGLVQDAWRVRMDFSDVDINHAASWLNAKVCEGHPSLPVNTETLLRTFRRYVPEMAA